MKKLDLIFNDLIALWLLIFIVFIMMHFGLKNQNLKVIYHFEIFRKQGNDKVGAIFGANANSLGFTTLLADKCKGTVLTKDGKKTSELVYSTYNLKQLNLKTNRVYLINEKTQSSRCTNTS